MKICSGQKKVKLIVRDQIQTMKVFWRLKLTFTQKTLEKEFEKYVGLFSFFLGKGKSIHVLKNRLVIQNN